MINKEQQQDLFHIWVILQPWALVSGVDFYYLKRVTLGIYIATWPANIPKVEEIFMHVWIFVNLSLQN